MKGLLIGLLALGSISTFAADFTCTGKLDGDATKIYFTENNDDTLKVTLKIEKDLYNGKGIIIDKQTSGYAITAILTAKDEKALLLNVDLLEDFSAGNASLTMGSEVTTSKLVCTKN